MRKILLGGLVVIVSFAAAVVGMEWLWPESPADRKPVLAETPPLQPITRKSVIVMPVSLSIAAVQKAIDTAAPRELSGTRDKPLSQFLSDVKIAWKVARGPLSVAGNANGLTFAAPFNGSFRASGRLDDQVGEIGSALGDLLGDKIGRQIGALAGKNLNQRTELRGSTTVSSRLTLTPNWRIEPNLTANLSLADATMSIAGTRINVTREVKPFIERGVSRQVAALESRFRKDPTIENTARREWAKICRTIPVGAAGPGLPNLWLEMRPTRAFAGQPRANATTVTMPIGIEAETRVVASETKPDCPFPKKLEIIPELAQGRVNVGVPIEVPLAEVSRILDARLKGRTFPKGGNATFSAIVQRASIAASGDRLLMTLLVKSTQNTALFGSGGNATVHVWGKPVLDRDRQVLRFTDIAIAVESEGAFGLLGAAARAAIAGFQSALESAAVIELKPFLTNARQSIAEAIADYRVVTEGVRVEAAITGLRLAEIAFDAQTLRLIAEADGTASVAITALPKY